MPERQLRGVCHFSTKLVAMATFLEILKKKSRSIICTQEKIAKIGPVDPGIIAFRTIIKKYKKETN